MPTSEATRRPSTAEDCTTCRGCGTNTCEGETPADDETCTCDDCDGRGWHEPTAQELADRAANAALNERLRRDGMPGFTYVEGRGWRKA